MIVEIITNDGEVISSEEENFYDIILKNIPNEKIKDYFLKKEIFLKIKKQNENSNGSCGINKIELSNIILINEVELVLNYLEEKKYIQKRKGINHDLYFLKTKNK